MHRQFGEKISKIKLLARPRPSWEDKACIELEDTECVVGTDLYGSG
jgi:hypothetical protein